MNIKFLFLKLIIKIFLLFFLILFDFFKKNLFHLYFLNKLFYTVFF